MSCRRAWRAPASADPPPQHCRTSLPTWPARAPCLCAPGGRQKCLAQTGWGRLTAGQQPQLCRPHCLAYPAKPFSCYTLRINYYSSAACKRFKDQREHALLCHPTQRQMQRAPEASASQGTQQSNMNESCMDRHAMEGLARKAQAQRFCPAPVAFLPELALLEHAVQHIQQRHLPIAISLDSS